MKSRWLLNLVLLLAVGAIAIFLYLRPKPVEKGPKAYTLSTLDAGRISRITVEVPAKRPVRLEKQQGRWRMVEPYQARADETSMERIVALLNATSPIKLPAEDLARFGLDSPALKLRLDDEEFSFGMYQPVSGEQFVAYKGSVYAIAPHFSEEATAQPLELLDKRPFDPDEQIVGFDFSGLEQWEKLRLQVERQPDGKWKVTPEKAKPDQNALNEWFDAGWRTLRATAVAPFVPDRAPHPYLIVKLKSGKTVRLIKMQESPELLLVREDQQMQYRFPQDTGFEILNPPVGFRQD
ncbi:MAG: DUF4340 domain-containing protein [Methylophilaceae bacterium]|nr:DUF4340 domain-containing protein [Methylophilaceae bacterium]